jgi:ubiquitin C-terminal hydrolase
VIISNVSCLLTWIDPTESFSRYRCSRCQSLEDATRQLILQKLPPVLHFSLLRFVFDVTTLERKKRKHNISFPVVLDMNRYLRNQDSANQENTYELKGVLVHKGSSAYHGHYEAMVFDAT